MVQNTTWSKENTFQKGKNSSKKQHINKGKIQAKEFNIEMLHDESMRMLYQ